MKKQRASATSPARFPRRVKRLPVPSAPAELLAISDDEQLGFAIWNWWIAFQAEHYKGISPSRVTSQIKEQIRVATLAMDTDSPQSVGVEKAMKLAAGGEFKRAGSLVRGVIGIGAHHLAAVDEARTGRRAKRDAASKQRRDNLQLLIESVVAKDAGISEKKLRKELDACIGRGVIESIDDVVGKITFHRRGRQLGTAQLSGLKDRLLRAKKFSR